MFFINKVEIKTEEINPERIITKSNKIIESRYALGPNEQKLILILASAINSVSDKQFFRHKFKHADLADAIGFEANYTYWKRLIEGLMSKVLVITETKPDGKTKNTWVNWFSYASYEEGIITLEFHDELKPYMLQLGKEYTPFQLKNVLKLDSNNAIRLYELLKQYEPIGSRKFEIVELKELLGIKPTAYAKYYDFKRYVILKAQQELKEKTDIKFEFEEIKIGRKVNEINFKIIKQYDEAEAIPAAPPEDIKLDKLNKRLESANLSGIMRNSKTSSLINKLLDLPESNLSCLIDNLVQIQGKKVIKDATSYLIANEDKLDTFISGEILKQIKVPKKEKTWESEYEIYVSPAYKNRNFSNKDLIKKER